MRAKSLLWAACAVTVVAAIGIAVFREVDRDVPAGQPPLTSLKAGDLAAFRRAFDAHADRPRILAVLSPT